MISSIQMSIKRSLVGLALLAASCTYAAELQLASKEFVEKALANERVCFVNALSKSGRMTAQLHDHFNGSNHCIRFVGSLKDPQVIEYTDRLYAIHRKSEVTLEGGRKTQTGEALYSGLKAVGLIPERPFTGKVIVDDYNNGTPIVLLLKNVEQFRDFASYFKSNVSVNQTSDAPRPLFTLSIQNDLLLKSLNDEDKTFINTYFSYVPFADETLNAKVTDIWGRLKEENCSLEGSRPTIINETTCEALLRNFEGTFKEFETNRIATMVVTAIAAGITYDYFVKPFISKCGSKVVSLLPTVIKNLVSK